MLYQVQLENGQKVAKPLSGVITSDNVASGDMHPVTSNAVAQISVPTAVPLLYAGDTVPDGYIDCTEYTDYDYHVDEIQFSPKINKIYKLYINGDYIWYILTDDGTYILTINSDTLSKEISLSPTNEDVLSVYVIEARDCYMNVITPNWKGTLAQAESFIATFFAQTDDSELQIYNDDRVTYEESIYNIDISTLSTYLAGLDPNTVSNAYKIYIRGLTTGNASDIKAALFANPTKYVDLRDTIIPSGTDCSDLFFDYNSYTGCPTLVYAPVLSSGITSWIYLRVCYRRYL